jgi:hypothetical protein
MQKAVKEATAFCDQYDVAPYGRTFSEFRDITVVNFFNKIYDASLTTRIAELEALQEAEFNRGVKECFDFITGLSANTDDNEKSSILQDAAEYMLDELSPSWNTKWKTITALTSELEALQAPMSCDGCEYRVHHSYYDGVQIDKCSIRDQLHFNGSCDGLVCTKYEPKDSK